MPSAVTMLHRRRIVPQIDLRVGAPWVAPAALRAATVAPITVTDMEYAVLASVCGTLGGVAWGMGVSRGQAKQSIAKVASKIPGTLPAFVRVIVWVRGATTMVLGDPSQHGRIPEHLVRPNWRDEHAAMATPGRRASLTDTD